VRDKSQRPPPHSKSTCVSFFYLLKRHEEKQTCPPPFPLGPFLRCLVAAGKNLLNKMDPTSSTVSPICQLFVRVVILPLSTFFSLATSCSISVTRLVLASSLWRPLTFYCSWRVTDNKLYVESSFFFRDFPRCSSYAARAK